MILSLYAFITLCASSSRKLFLKRLIKLTFFLRIETHKCVCIETPKKLCLSSYGAHKFNSVVRRISIVRKVAFPG